MQRCVVALNACAVACPGHNDGLCRASVVLHPKKKMLAFPGDDAFRSAMMEGSDKTRDVRSARSIICDSWRAMVL